ncbi:MAG: aspartyl protease family protein [Caulobacteraceae bacterium]
MIKAFLCLAAVAFATVASAASRCKVEKIADLPVTMAGAPLVPASINGTDVRLIADSGAFFSLISPAMAAQLKLPLTTSPYLDTLTGIGGSVGTRVTRVAALTLAGQALHNAEFLVAGNGLGPEVAGLIGQNILGFADVEYDLANGFIRLWRPSRCGSQVLAYWLTPTQSYGELDLDREDLHHTIGAVYLNGVRLRALFDTGGGPSFVTRRAARRAGVDPNGSGSVAGGVVVGGIGLRTFDSRIAPVASFKVGGEEIRNTRMRVGEVADMGIDMWLGVDFFLSHRVYVSNSQHRIYFTYNGGPVFDLSKGGGARRAAANEAPARSSAGAPTDADDLARRGTASLARGDVKAAVADLTAARTAAPDDAQDAYQLAMAHLANSQLFLAMADLNDAVRLAPAYAPARLQRAGLRLRGHDTPGALADLDAVDHLAANGADARLQLGHLYIAAQTPRQAVRQFDLWLASHPADVGRATALNGRCWARALLGEDLAKALADCNAALRSARGRAEVLDSRGLVYLRLGEFQKAITDYDAALALEPKIAWSLYGRGIARLRVGKADEGRADIAAANALSPRLAEQAKGYGVTP